MPQLERQVKESKIGTFTFLRDVADSDLRLMNDFVNSSTCAFIMKLIANKITALALAVLKDTDLQTKPGVFAFRQGEANGLQFFKVYIDAVNAEWKQRLARRESTARADSK